jgi:hypothetical protein
MRRACLIALVLVFLAGCQAQGGVEASSGEPLTPEEQASLYEERLEQEGEPNAGIKGTVYWTPSGEKYHKDPNCSYLKNAKEVLSGTAAQAANHGASEPCSRCAGG